MAIPTQTETFDLGTKFPGIVLPDERENYAGWIVEKAIKPMLVPFVVTARPFFMRV